MGPTYEIYRDGELFAVVKKQLFSALPPRLLRRRPRPQAASSPKEISEDLEFTFIRGDKTVATVSRQWISWADTYGLDIAEGEDDVLILASSIVIDMVRSERDT